MARNNRDLPTLGDLAVTHKFAKGQRIIVTASAGPRLAGTRGVVVGKGTTRSQVRVLLAGSTNFVTLHSRFVLPDDAS